ncbi:MAG: hypothetical protein COV99_08050 [Bacteroidetes bacterium CG12_big_fil_rev_8_21_14_0_65_60_17]|nr:MAG: hypothetical protein COV99_08050 [Bacteroidetes bacterium CG12_big_fil_rev_8_21_14_0_65_60_17]
MSPIRLGPLPVILFLLFAAACGDEPSEVGIGLVDAQSGRTTTEFLPVVGIQPDGPADITGGTLAGGASGFLTGRVFDPAVGMIARNAFVDFAPATTPGRRAGEVVQSVELRFPVNYVLGDTLSTLSLQIHAMTEEWTAEGRRADTTLTTGALVTEVDVPVTTDTLRITMPAEWVSSNAQLLLSADMQTLFNGFRLRATSGNAVIGSSLFGSRLQVLLASGERVDFPLSRFLTVVDDSVPGATDPLPENVLLDTGLSSLSLKFPIPDTVSVHRAELRIDMSQRPQEDGSSFVRPPFSTLALRAVTEDGSSTLNVETVAVDATGRATFRSSLITNIIQQASLGTSNFDRFELYIPVSSTSIGHHRLRRDEDNSPRLLLTYSPMD